MLPVDDDVELVRARLPSLIVTLPVVAVNPVPAVTEPGTDSELAKFTVAVPPNETGEPEIEIFESVLLKLIELFTKPAFGTCPKLGFADEPFESNA